MNGEKSKKPFTKPSNVALDNIDSATQGEFDFAFDESVVVETVRVNHEQALSIVSNVLGAIENRTTVKK